MKRAIFIKRTLLGLTSLFVPLNEQKKNKQVYLSKFYVAGFAYYDGDSVLKDLKVNDQLIIKHEPQNPYDHRALEIYTASGAKLGYVPRTDNPIPSRLLRQHVKLTGAVETIDPAEDNWKKVKVRLYMVV